MKTQNSRLEDLEKTDAPEESFNVITQDLENKERYTWTDKETGEKVFLSLEEAKARFTDGTLLIVNYVEKLKSKVYMKDGDQ